MNIAFGVGENDYHLARYLSATYRRATGELIGRSAGIRGGGPGTNSRTNADRPARGKGGWYLLCAGSNSIIGPVLCLIGGARSARIFAQIQESRSPRDLLPSFSSAGLGNFDIFPRIRISTVIAISPRTGIAQVHPIAV